MNMNLFNLQILLMGKESSSVQPKRFECLAQTLSVFSPNGLSVQPKRSGCLAQTLPAFGINAKNALFFMPVFESFFHGPLLFSSSPLLLPLSFFFFIFFFIKGCRGKSFFFVFCFFLLRFSGDFSRDIGGIILLFQPSYFIVSVPPLLQAS